MVANEVKELAKQTGKATEDLGEKIQLIQDSMKEAMEAIGSISYVINQINDISNTIAGGVEEQSVTTQDISRNVAEAARGGRRFRTTWWGLRRSRKTRRAGRVTRWRQRTT